ncbi:MAG: nucleotide exchange factor GrpE [bacterium]|nr:nucleotide exchange factor GrpE [bacterium]
MPILPNNNSDAPQAGGRSPDPIVGVNNEVERLKQERDEYLNGWKRAKADLINYQRDEGKRFEEIMCYTTESVIGDLMTVLDSMEFALRAEPSNDGLQRIKIQLEDELKKYGLEKIKVSPGDAFDTNVHESLGEIELKEIASGTTHSINSGQVAVEVSSGYKIKNKVIRPTRVKLAK